MKLYLIVGLPGSGKSHYIKILQKHKQVRYGIHDYYAGRIRNGVVTPSRSNFHDKLMDAIDAGENIAVADILFISDMIREEFIEYVKSLRDDIEIHIVAFTNDPESCLRNIEARMQRKEIFNEKYYQQFVEYISEATKGYDPTKLECELIQAWNGEIY